MKLLPRARPVSSAAFTRVIVAAIIAVAIARLSAQTVVPGHNVNMVSGTDVVTGDPFLQRQNEPTIAASTRNILHLVGGANDYRTVDLPGLPDDKPTGDSWLGLFKSFNGGQTWTSTLIPGFPQDTSAVGMASVLKNYDAAADPLVRAGANGLFFFSGIAFQRSAPTGASAVRAGVERAERERTTAKSSRREGKDAREREREREREHKRERERERERGHKDGKVDDRMARLQGGAEDDDEEAAGVGGTASAIFVTTLLDLNNRENGDPIAYVRTTLVDSDQGTRFLDKQWTAVDVPRSGAQMCTFDVTDQDGQVVHQSFPGGRIYIAYAAFTGSGPTQKGQILLSYSSDCGLTWSRPKDISSAPTADVNGDGVVTTADVNLVKAVFGKRCGDPGFSPAADTNQDCIVSAFDLAYVTQAVGKPLPARRIPQGATIAIDPNTGALNVTWREFKAGGAPDAIQFVRSTNFGVTFTQPATVATFVPYDQATTDTSFRTSAFPTIAADGARVYVAWSARGHATNRPDPLTGDARIVMSTSTTGASWTPPRPVDESGRPGHQIMPALNFGGGRLSLLYYDLREDVSRLFGPFVDEFPILNAPAPKPLRHTLDVRIAQASPAAAPQFTSVQLSEYATGVPESSTQVQQLQFNPPNLPIFKQGSVPFVGDYIDLTVTPSMVVDADGRWTFNVGATDSGAGHAVWADNRDVRVSQGGSLAPFTPPNSKARGTTSIFDPTQPLPSCVPDQTGTRNQNIYTARFDRGLFTGAVGNSKPLDTTLERAFALFIENATSQTRSYRLTIPAQPAGGHASFQQVATGGAILPQLDLSIPARSTAARTLYVTSSDPKARIDIDVSEIGAPGDAAPVAGGLHGSIVLNSDPAAPRIENPRIENSGIPASDIQSSEVYTARLSTATTSPRIENPRIENPRIENPRIENVSADNRDVVNSGVQTPRIENATVETPRIENPRIENIDLENGAISDTTWELTNAGNTAAVYGVDLRLNRPIPLGFKTQLIIHKTYVTPAADGCELKQQIDNVVITNITTPAFAPATPRIENPRIENPRIENATVALAPGETANVTFRVFDPDRTDQVTFDPAASVTPVAAPQSVDTQDAQAGQTEPPVVVALTITTAAFADAQIAVLYSQQLQANVAGTWAISSGTLPPGLTLNTVTGLIEGRPTASGTFVFTARFADTGSPAQTVTRDFAIRVGGPLQIATDTLPDGIANVGYVATAASTGGIGALSWSVTSGALPGGVSLNPATGVLSGTPTASDTFPFTLTVRDDALPPHVISRAFAIRVVEPFAFAKIWLGVDANWSNPANWNPAGEPNSQTNVVIPGGVVQQPVLTADSFVNSLQLAPGATLNTNGHTLTASGSVSAGNTITGTGTLVMTGGEVTLSGTVSNVVINGSTGLNGALTVTGGLTINGTLLLNGHAATVGGMLVASGDPALIAGGAGGLTTDDITGWWSGTIVSTVGATTTKFTVNFLLRHDGSALSGTAPLLPGIELTGTRTGVGLDGSLQFAVSVQATDLDNPSNPNSPATFTGSAIVDVNGNLFIGTVSGTNTDGLAETGVLTLQKTSPVTAGGVDVNGLLLDDVVLTVTGSAPVTRFDNVTFSNARTAAVQFLISHAGAASPFAFDSLRFETPPQSGAYIQAIDTQPEDGNVLTIDLTHAQATDGPGFTMTQGGAVVNWLGNVADLAISQSDAPDPVQTGANVTYTVVITNNGPDHASELLLVDTLPVGTTFVGVSSTTVDASCNREGQILTCQLGGLNPGAAISLDIVVKTSVPGSIENLATISASATDPNPSNNTATATTTVTPSALTFVVTTTNDSGPGSLRQAITDSNLNTGSTNQISFAIPGTGPFTIALASLLPDIVVPAVIDATTQSGFAGAPIVELNGANSSGAAGLNITGGGSTIRGFVINRFGAAGITLSGNGGNVIEGNYLGTDLSGTAEAHNGTGVYSFSANNRIGGTTANARNIISGNLNGGVIIVGATATGNVVSGNYIGTNASGTGALPNGGGVFIQDASSNTIGGNSPAARNIISGNGTIGAGGTGVNVGGTATGNRITGNYVGTDVTGTFAVPNTGNGVCLCPSSSGTFLGGDGPGDGNLISGNGTTTQFYAAGVNIVGSNANILAGNFIGTNHDGISAIPNLKAGISISTSNNNTIGGTTVLARNLISGNGTADNFAPGVNLNLGSTNNQVIGNWIGTNRLGTGVLGNLSGGVFISSPGNTIGGATAERRNVISGNAGAGVNLNGETAAGNVIAGNFIGTDLNGTGALPNTGQGVNISAASNIVGPGNVISSNSHQGVLISGSSATNNTVKSNRIGTDANGTAALGNGGDGVLLFNGASNNTIGGLTVGDGNLISGNQFGMSMAGALTTGNKVWGNLIGTNAAGNAALGNLTHGININSSAAGNFVGGTAAGAGNVIAGNFNGILVLSGATNNAIQGNRIGTSQSGAAIANTSNGIYVDGGLSNTIGGTAPGAANVIAFSSVTGVNVASGIGNAIRGNAIFSNGFLGIDLGSNGVTSNDAGDPDAGANALQNYPELTLAEAGSSTIVSGILNSTPNTLFTLDFFANSVADPSGFGEGQRFLGSINVVTPQSGAVAFSSSLASLSAAGEFITATATDPVGNTSEFSAARVVQNVGAIAGHITDDAAIPLLAPVTVMVFNSSGALTTTVSTDQSGNYRTNPGLTPGTYFVRTANAQPYVDQLNANIPCVPGCVPTNGTPVEVTGGATTTVNFALTRGGNIAGRVTDDVTLAGLSNVAVDVYSASGTFVTTSSTGASGNYVTFAGLPAGNYFARTRGATGHVDELYNNIPCISCDVATGNAIAVTTATTTSGINFALAPAAILVADSPIEGVTGRILKVSADGSSLAVFANTGGCPTKLARRPSGNILAADPCQNRVLEITPAGVVSTLPIGPIQFPYAIAIEPNSGNIFVADSVVDVIYRITPAGAVSQFAVIPGGSPFTLQNTSLAVSGLDVVAAYDDYNGVSGQTAIIKIDPTGTQITTLFQGTAIGSMGGLALESSGTFVIPDGANNRLIRFNPVGGTITPIATDPVALCCDLLGVAIESTGNFIVAVNSQNRLVRITPAGVITSVIQNAQLRKSHALLMYP